MSGLDIEAPAGLGEAAEHAVHETWNTLDDVMTMLTKAGFPPIDAPQFQMMKISPNDLANATSQQYSIWFSCYEAWQGYSSQYMNYYQAKRLEITNEAATLTAKIRKSLRTEKPKPSEDTIKDIVATTPRIVELLRMEQQHKQAELMLEPQYEHIKKTIQLLSRHLSVRQFEAEVSGGRGSRGYGSNG